jgi:prepilin-type N-terminal cleavage/methylation domain-containing protein
MDSQRTVRDRCSGFSLLEMLIVVAVAGVIAAIALPNMMLTIRRMYLNSATSSLSGAIMSTRYQSIATGCPMQLAISTGTYQVSTEQVIAGAGIPACAGVWSYWCANGQSATTACPVQYSNSNIYLVSPTPPVTLQFNPSGTVVLAGTTTAPPSIKLGISTDNATKTLTVSGVGNVQVQ